MNATEQWAIVIRVAGRMLRKYRRAGAESDPALLVQQVAQNLVICGGAAESFSPDMPIFKPSVPAEEGLFPIDVLYGHYDSATRSIEIFVNRISQDAPRFGAEVEELLEIVRIHEQAHAVIHLGVRAAEVQEFAALGQSHKTPWPEFVADRSSWFTEFSQELHEFLAQALTYAALSNLSEPQRTPRMREVFDALEAKQPPQYKLSETVKRSAAVADWPLVLDAARGVIDVYRGQDFTLSAGLESLISSYEIYPTS